MRHFDKKIYLEVYFLNVFTSPCSMPFAYSPSYLLPSRVVKIPLPWSLPYTKYPGNVIWLCSVCYIRHPYFFEFI